MRYITNADGDILAEVNEDQMKTVVVSHVDMPIDSWRIANLMNSAYTNGYEKAKEDIRRSLGIK